MQKLADGVGSLQRVLTNVKSRGVFGEVQLAGLLEVPGRGGQVLAGAIAREDANELVIRDAKRLGLKDHQIHAERFDF